MVFASDDIPLTRSAAPLSHKVPGVLAAVARIPVLLKFFFPYISYHSLAVAGSLASAKATPFNIIIKKTQPNTFFIDASLISDIHIYILKIIVCQARDSSDYTIYTMDSYSIIPRVL
jgi:hypothetical protein